MEKRYKRKAAALMGLTVLSCGTLFVSLTAAWFTTLRQAQNNTEGFKIGDTVLIEEIKFYQHKSTTNGLIDFYPAESTYEIGDGRYKSDLGFYNLLESNYQTLMEITLTKDAVDGEYELDFNATTFATQSHLTANSTGSPNYPLTNDPSRNNSLSSIIDFYVFFQKDVQVSNQKISLSKAENENNRDINNKEICNFIDKNDDIVESKSINLVSFNAKDIAVDGVSKIYVMLDYNEENCAKMYGNNIGNTAIEKGHFLRKGTDLPILKFDADFEFDLIMK